MVGGTTINYSGAHFTPNTTVTLKYYRKSVSGTPLRTWTASVGCGGGFTTSVKTPTGVIETDYVTACDAAGRCLPNPATIGLLL